MKTLELIAAAISGKVVKLRFSAHGHSAVGYCIIDSENNELLTCEPVYYSNGDRWKVDNKSDKGSGIFYCKSLTELKGVKVTTGYTGHKFNVANQ